VDGDRRAERDACGIGFVADAGGRPSAAIVRLALQALRRMRHRGAVAADSLTGDGAGVLLPLPVPFLAHLAVDRGVDAPPSRLGLAMCFFDRDAPQAAVRRVISEACEREGLRVAAWRPVPVEPDALGEHARRTLPRIEQALLARSEGVDEEEAERRAFRARWRAELRSSGHLYVTSLSFRTVTYKALCAADQLGAFYPDLDDPDVAVPFAVFHQRYSTNTDPSWERAQPFRMLCHNGEINTIDGNALRMTAREADLGGEVASPDLLRGVLDRSGSDSAMLDQAAELLTRGGRDLHHAMAMLVPPVWEGDAGMDPTVRGFHRYHACLMEPWDGPAGLVFSDGRRVGAALDRNGLRPLRFAATADGLVVCASEAGVADLDGRGPVRRGRLGPGQMILVDPEEGGLLEHRDIKARLAGRRPYGAWADRLAPGDPGEPVATVPEDLTARQVAFGFTKEEVTVVLRPMAVRGQEPTSSMGDDTAPAALADRPRLPTAFLKQRFAQVTNPPIDHLRERAVMSLRTLLGPRAPLLEESPDAADRVELPSFLLYPSGVAGLNGSFLDATFPVTDGPPGLEKACRRLGEEAERLVATGSTTLVLSDSAIGPGRAPVPSVLAAGAVHHGMIRAGLRTRATLIVEAGDVRDAHDAACLLGYGVDALCPRTALQTITALSREGRLGAGAPECEEALRRFNRALEDGVLKVMSKMGISTLDGYRGGQAFEAVGLADEVIELCLADTPSALGAVGFTRLGRDVLRRHDAAYGERRGLENPGLIKHRSGGEYHATNPEVVRSLHAAVTGEDPDGYRRFAELVDGRPPTAPRDLLETRPAGPPVRLEEVEPAERIVRRFSTGAMSHGALSAEAHETIAVAMNRIGGRANTGEGGEDRARYRDGRNSSIKQVASGRFGVTPEYCVFATELQIKMAQGSKPGEGGQLPGPKVTEEIARLRGTPPGVALISPPPHHDIYSIEDLAQLIFDLRQVNPEAEVSVKLVASAGVGTVAAGVAKALADVIHIAGADGGTGASPLSSILNAAVPWEVGLSEARRVLGVSGLRGRVRLRVDGGMRTGRDVLMASLLGADEVSFGTSVLVAQGCLMVRTCHRDTCPVGIATQRPELRAKFTGTPEAVVSYLLHVAEDVRRLLASLGMRSLEEAVGRTDLLRPSARAEGLDPGRLVDRSPGPSRFESTAVGRPRSALGDRVHREAMPALVEGRILELTHPISITDRAVGARLGGAVAGRFGTGRPPGRVRIRFRGSAGQSFGAFLTDGIELDLTGEANDYVGKGMAGGRIVIRPREEDAPNPVVAGNTVLYGATGGRLFCAGLAGERFAVRNSGAVAVVEGVGDHACEYMTGGAVVVLGPVGANLGAGMTGGEAYVLDPQGLLPGLVNPQLVELRPAGPARLPSLRRLVERHALATGSARACSLLETWPQAAPSLVRVSARDEVAGIERALEGTAGA
jgi:glutamate synthase domain-containing protein 2/glutamate synthase domain-containing protein 1/glutamate synthase domain-containing protein 3